MAWPRTPAGIDLWADGAAFGQVQQQTFRGADGLAALSGPMHITAPDPSTFSATLTRGRFGHVLLDHFSATAHTVERRPTEIADQPTPLLGVVFVLEGETEVRLPDSTFQVSTGQAVLMDTRVVAGSTAPGPVRLLRAFIDVREVPAALRRETVTIPGPLPRSSLLESYRAFISAALRQAEADPVAAGLDLTAVVAELHAAVLAEAQNVVDLPQGPAGLRYRIEALIQQHHTDPTLDVTGIARRLNISTRRAHQVFNHGEHTIGHALRDRRVATAAYLLRAARGTANLTEIADDAGFSDREALNYAFHKVLGVTPRDYLRHNAS